jgi:glycopeptide antibiotics resistance protein
VRGRNNNMLFNVLSCIMVYIIANVTIVIVHQVLEKRALDDEETKLSAVVAIIITIAFTWIMSWQNWWR